MSLTGSVFRRAGMLCRLFPLLPGVLCKGCCVPRAECDHASLPVVGMLAVGVVAVTEGLALLVTLGVLGLGEACADDLRGGASEGDAELSPAESELRSVPSTLAISGFLFSCVSSLVPTLLLRCCPPCTLFAIRIYPYHD